MISTVFATPTGLEHAVTSRSMTAFPFNVMRMDISAAWMAMKHSPVFAEPDTLMPLVGETSMTVTPTHVEMGPLV